MAARTDRLYDREEFTHRGIRFLFRTERDDDMAEPWKEHDGHGIVSEWTSRAKRPGERILIEDRGSYRYYDVQASTKLALRDGWDAEPYHAAHPTETKREQAVRAVAADFQHLRGWCHDDWYWCGVIVRRLDTGAEESMWGIESTDAAYHATVAHDLAEELIDDDGDRVKFETARVLAPWPDVR